jgi:hypothetical protein
MADVTDYEAELLAGIGPRLDTQTELLGKVLERLTELRVILQGLADRG